MIENKTTARDKNFVRIIQHDTKRRVKGGTVRDDQVKYKDRILKGGVRHCRCLGRVYDLTFFTKADGTELLVEGYDWVWLARKNGLTGMKVDGHDLQPEEFVKEAA
jgi:hypothetical protein